MLSGVCGVILLSLRSVNVPAKLKAETDTFGSFPCPSSWTEFAELAFMARACDPVLCSRSCDSSCPSFPLVGILLLYWPGCLHLFSLIFRLEGQGPSFCSVCEAASRKQSCTCLRCEVLLCYTENCNRTRYCHVQLTKHFLHG